MRDRDVYDDRRTAQRGAQLVRKLSLLDRLRERQGGHMLLDGEPSKPVALVALPPRASPRSRCGVGRGKAAAQCRPAQTLSLDVLLSDELPTHGGAILVSVTSRLVASSGPTPSREPVGLHDGAPRLPLRTHHTFKTLHRLPLPLKFEVLVFPQPD